MNRFTRCLQKSLSRRDPAALGLSEGLKTTITEIFGQKLLADLLITQDVWTVGPTTGEDHGARLEYSAGSYRRRTSSGTACSPRSTVVPNTRSLLHQCQVLLLELEDEEQKTRREPDTGRRLPEDQQVSGLNTSRVVCSSEWPKEAEEKPPAAAAAAPPRQPDGGSEPRPLLSFLLGEWKLLHTMLQAATQEMTDVASSCRCQRCDDIRKVLSEGRVPPWWNVYSPASPVPPQLWIQGLHVRGKLLSTYISEPSPFNVPYNISVFQQPSRLLHSLLQERALEDHRELERYHLHVQVSGRTSPSLQPQGISLVGIHLCHALWDTRLNLLQETLSPQLCSLPVVHVSAAPENRGTEYHAPPSEYLCPLYTQEGTGGNQENPLLLLPLPTKVPPCVWSQRRVHALSLL